MTVSCPLLASSLNLYISVFFLLHPFRWDRLFVFLWSMAMEDTESCSSRSVESPTNHPRQQRHKLEVYNKVLHRLKNSGIERHAGFDDDLWAHFNRLPARYALDVNVERAEDVLTHARLLQLAVDPDNRPAFDVRVVQVLPAIDEGVEREDISRYFSKHSLHPPPAFGSSSNLEALVDANKSQLQDGDSIKNINNMIPRPMHEITFSADDRPKLLSQLTSLLAEIGLNIQEAHAFSTNDGYSLDVFVVEGWPYEETEKLRQELQREILKFEKRSMSKSMPKSQKSPLILDKASVNDNATKEQIQIPTDGVNVWEIDIKLLKFERKVASGSYGDLYRGSYCSQDVAIKVLKPERMTADMQNDFAHEVFMMTKVRHKNVVQFIGACTKHPNLCIVTEFMSRGSVYDFLHKHKRVLDAPAVIRVAVDVSKGMNYLHQNNIIHRDLKAANLLMDENDVVKVGDFGVSRVISETGVMTAETGTYRWMAPEVIEHKPYDHKADVFSFAIVLWELLTGKIPYEFLTPLQAAVGVVQSSMRPVIPKNTNQTLKDLLQRCWQQNPTLRPEFSEILDTLQMIAKEVESDQDRRRKNKAKSLGGIFSGLKRG